ncbi:AAA family ATPase [Methanobacterium aggregans]|uniref:AAA family ATPase n=1 Tax=Methanobacterium aggregans TaxID=1615586 RepID=UPI001AE397CF|nr:AAA family ATPase [Methanobacterium aggregans]MBP2045231.1 dephospho-CoA kinase [Methanobacterium aggregans]
MKVIGVTGLPGSGKSVVSRVAKNLKIPIVRMGDVIRDEAEKRGSTPGEVAVKLREEYGEFVVAERCVESIKSMDKKHNPNMNQDTASADDVYMIEGIRSPYEVEIFRKNFKDFKVIAVHSTPKTRFKRLKKRMRDDDSMELSQFKKRDERELNFGIGNVIATSDYMIVNEGPVKKLKNVVRGVLKNEMQSKG